ncbi:TPA: hydrogenase maturation nickel metallochaperone HypA [Escherichia coli]|nr:hydrogenase maturation nickel metallochaperone HypA [Escherichia coli]
MHELSLCQSAVEIIQRQAEQHDVKRVTAVWLEIGALSCVEESAVRFSFEIVCHGTVAQGCDLHIVYKPAQARCWLSVKIFTSLRRLKYVVSSAT